VVNGAAAVDSLDGEEDVPDADGELFVDDPDELVVLLVNVQPESNIPVTSTAASNHRWVT
jgi:hypothetical protein